MNKKSLLIFLSIAFLAVNFSFAMEDSSSEEEESLVEEFDFALHQQQFHNPIEEISHIVHGSQFEHGLLHLLAQIQQHPDLAHQAATILFLREQLYEAFFAEQCCKKIFESRKTFYWRSWNSR